MIPLKRLLPYDAFTITTVHSVDQLIQLLDRQVEPRKYCRFGRGDHKVFQGEFSEEGFTLSRIIHYRNSFLPVIRGRFQPNDNGTDILITLSLHPVVIGFMAFWLWAVGSIAIAMLAAAAFSSDIPWVMPLVPLGMFMFGWAMLWGGFWAEASPTKQTLMQLLR